MTINRRVFLKAAAAGALATQGVFPRTGYAAPKGKPILLGHQCTLTGGFSSWGYWLDKAARAAVQYVNGNGGIAGRPVEYIVEDDESSPPVGARKFRSLVQRSKVDFVIGSTHTGVALASNPVAKELKTIYFPVGMAEEITGVNGNRYVFRIAPDTYAQAAAGAEWAFKNLGKNWTFIFADYGWGWSHFNEHKKVLEKLGAKIANPIAVPLDAKDLLPYLARVPADTQVLYSIFFAAQSTAYYTQSKSMGLDQKMQRYSVVCTHEAISPRDLGGASEGVYLLEYHPRQLKFKDTVHNRKFRDLMEIDPVDGREKGSTRVVAGSHHWATWETVFFIKKAIEKSGWGSRRDNLAFIKALEGMRVEESIEHPQGAKYVRPSDHKAIIDFKMSRIEKDAIVVKREVPSKDVESYFPPRYDFSKETI